MKKTKTPLALLYLRTVYNTIGRIFPNYFANHALQLWSTAMRFKTPDYEQPAFKSATLETIKINGVNVTTYSWQDDAVTADKTLLFVHGWAGRGTQIAHYIKALNAKGYHIISFDAPAHGNSSGTQTSLFEFTDIVFELDKRYGPFDAAITHSVGGMVLMFAMSLGVKINRVACICPPISFDEITDNFQRILNLPENIKKILVRKTYVSHGQTIRNAVNALTNAKKMRSKALLIHDQDDNEFSWHDSEKIAMAWPGARFIKTEGLGHRRVIHDKTVIQNILKFLDETE